MILTTRDPAPPFLSLAALVLLLAGCFPETTPPGEEPTRISSIDRTAEAYVKLVLAVGRHEDGYVDAYYGPDEWRTDAAAADRSLADLLAEARSLQAALETPAAVHKSLAESLRHRFLKRQIDAVAARIEHLQGKRRTFDEESQAFYDAVAPSHPEEYFEGMLAELGSLLDEQGVPPGSFAERYATYRAGFVVPGDKVDAVFRAALEGCRERTLARIDLPEDESFVIEYVTGKSWSAYNWYQGHYHSLIQVNTDLPIHIDRALDLACHEGYPGHHVFNVLLEKNLVNERGWAEFTVYPLFSPQSLIAEGTANFGIEMAFPGDERLHFEREVLFPLAGLDRRRAATYNAVRQLTERLDFVGNEAARRYLDGEITAGAAAEWLSRFSGMSAERAAQRLRFIDQYRSYVINYNLGLDLVRTYVDLRAPLADGLEHRWQVLSDLMAMPRLPSELAQTDPFADGP